MKTGFIGLGTMGSRMAANLQKQGHSLVVHNRTRAKAEPLLAGGAKWADSPAALAAQVDIVFTMLAYPDAVEEAALGKDGFLPHLEAGRMWVDCSTVNPSFSKKMAVEAKARGIRFLGAPVTGSKGPAAEAKLIFLGRRSRGRFGSLSAFAAVHGKQDRSLRRTWHGSFSQDGDESITRNRTGGLCRSFGSGRVIGTFSRGLVRGNI